MLKPIEIGDKEFKKVSRGFDERQVTDFLEQVYEDYDILYRENHELKAKLEEAHKNMEYYITMEDTMKKALVLAEKTAEEVKELAEEKARVIEEDARLRAENILKESKDRIFSLKQKISELEHSYELMKTRIKMLLDAEIVLLEKSDDFIRKPVGEDALE